MGIVVVGMGNTDVDASAPEYRYWNADDCYWRAGVRSCQFVIDRTLTATGFDGTEDIDWTNEYKAGPAS